MTPSDDQPREHLPVDSGIIPPVVGEPMEGDQVNDRDVEHAVAPAWLHPTSVFFEVSAQIRQFIFPVVVGLLGGAASGNFWSIWIAFPVLVVSLVVNFVRYLTLRYQVRDNELVVTEGLLFRRIRSVPAGRIQNIDYVQNLFHRLFGVAVVNVETASGDKPEATLRVIKLEQVEQLRQAVFGAAQLDAAASVDSSTRPSAAALGDSSHQAVAASETGNPAVGELLWSITPKQLLIAGLTSNRGMVLIGIVAGYFFQPDWSGRWSRDDFRASSEQLRGWLPEQFQLLGGALQLVVGVVAVLLVLRIVSVVWYFLRFYGYRLVLHGEDLRISCGLFTKVSATVPRERIQFISVHSPLLMRPFGMVSIRIETAGGGGNSGEDAAATVSRRWFVPVIEHGRALELLDVLRPSLSWEPAAVDWKGLSGRAPARMTRQAILLSIVVAVIGLAVTRPWGGLIGLALLPLLVILARKKARARRFARTSWGYAFQSGIMTRKMSFTFADRLQVVDFSQSWFDRRWKMATLRLDTAAAGPASHEIEIPFLDEQFARQEFSAVLAEAARSRPEFG
ncbi:MAG: PH domain-containing protein [Aureliella sp.]